MKIDEIVNEGFWDSVGSAVKDVGAAIKHQTMGTRPQIEMPTDQDANNALFNMWAKQVADLTSGGLLPAKTDPTYPAKYAKELKKFVTVGTDRRISSLYPMPTAADVANPNAYLTKVASINRAKKATGLTPVKTRKPKDPTIGQSVTDEAGAVWTKTRTGWIKAGTTTPITAGSKGAIYLDGKLEAQAGPAMPASSP